ncbi:uncharacterized protein LOC121200033 isoform X3 [Toxotes jaculatrix]|uniref:uncharacterized protein LOC121200033 isoform X3 n=1 Tax=Toxotes jaculatrix TaxID=941984 RepID=UPI001B3B1951|nr:uncharacterized protein LOC121200033 isoform X3 [Toxotes jaculatrix]
MLYVSLNHWLETLTDDGVRTRERKRDRSTMAGFKWTKWIQMSVFLMLVLLFTAGTGQRHHFTVRDGDKVTLPCENRIKDQDKCNSTTWIYGDTDRSPAVELIILGKIGEHAKDKSDRLSVTEDCSLVIEKVTVKDVGQYICRQFNNSGRQQGPGSVVDLSVINIHEDKVNMMLTCTVLTYDTQCRHTVQWLYEGKKDGFTITEKTPESCSATVTFKAPHHNHKSKYEESFKCNVTDSDSQNLLVYNFTLQSSGDRTAAPNGNRTTSGHNDDLLQWWYIVVPVGFAALLITVGAVIRQRRTKGNKTLRDENTGLTFGPAVTQSAPETSQDKADPEDGVFYTSISYARKADSKARVQGDDDEDDAVTYSTVKAPSSSAGASTDPSDFYATVNKPRT